jgi:hypothetical protein
MAANRIRSRTRLDQSLLLLLLLLLQGRWFALSGSGCAEMRQQSVSDHVHDF